MPLSKSAPAGTWIRDFQDSSAPQFRGKSPAERRRMALGAYYAKQRGRAEGGVVPRFADGGLFSQGLFGGGNPQGPNYQGGTASGAGQTGGFGAPQTGGGAMPQQSSLASQAAALGALTSTGSAFPQVTQQINDLFSGQNQPASWSQPPAGFDQAAWDAQSQASSQLASQLAAQYAQQQAGPQPTGFAAPGSTINYQSGANPQSGGSITFGPNGWPISGTSQVGGMDQSTWTAPEGAWAKPVSNDPLDVMIANYLSAHPQSQQFMVNSANPYAQTELNAQNFAQGVVDPNLFNALMSQGGPGNPIYTPQQVNTWLALYGTPGAPFYPKEPQELIDFKNKYANDTQAFLADFPQYATPGTPGYPSGGALLAGLGTVQNPGAWAQQPWQTPVYNEELQKLQASLPQPPNQPSVFSMSWPENSLLGQIYQLSGVPINDMYTGGQHMSQFLAPYSNITAATAGADPLMQAIGAYNDQQALVKQYAAQGYTPVTGVTGILGWKPSIPMAALTPSWYDDYSVRQPGTGSGGGGNLINPAAMLRNEALPLGPQGQASNEATTTPVTKRGGAVKNGEASAPTSDPGDQASFVPVVPSTSPMFGTIDREIARRRALDAQLPRSQGGLVGGPGRYQFGGALPQGIGGRGRPGAHLIKATTPGRTDRIRTSARPGSFVVPADVVSGLGQGNTEAGAAILGKVIATGPYGTQAPKMQRAKALSPSGRMPSQASARIPGAMRMGSPGLHMPRLGSIGKKKGFQDGGEVQDDEPTPIITAGGEMIIDPEVVQAYGGGDPEAGKKAWSEFVVNARKNIIAHMKKLPGPIQ